MVTGKNKKQFENWYANYNKLKENWHVIKEMYLEDFYNSDFLEQIGVYLAFYDSLDIQITVETAYMNQEDTLEWIYNVEVDRVGSGTIKETRNEAYREAFKKANEIINQ